MSRVWDHDCFGSGTEIITGIKNEEANVENKEYKDLEQDKDLEQVIDFSCDVCMESTQLNHAVLSADWGSGSKHDGVQYELHLCEACFFATLATLKREHRVKQMFNEDFNEAALEKFGLE